MWITLGRPAFVPPRPCICAYLPRSLAAFVPDRACYDAGVYQRLDGDRHACDTHSREAGSNDRTGIQVTASSGSACPNCGGRVTSDARRCGSCGQAFDPGDRRAPALRLVKSIPERQDGLEGAPYVISLDTLDPVEAVAWEVRGQKVTPPAFLKLLGSQGLDIESHALFGMIMACPERAEHITCSHKTHDSDARRDKCIRNQAAKIAARSLMHHIGFLYRLDMWSDPRSLMRHAMWSCIERHGRACAACRAREGVVVSVEDKRVPILHPGCNCAFVQLARGQLGGKTIQRTLRYVEARDPERARVMRENLAKSGFGAELGAGCCGCLLALLCLPVLLPLAVWGLVR